MSRAEYMRNYRALRKINEANSEEIADTVSTIAVLQRQKIEALEAEVKLLKAELAKRPVVEEPITMPNGDAGHQWRRATYSEPGFNSRPFTPAPKKGK